MENEYYIPDEEDIKIGYEIEYKNNGWKFLLIQTVNQLSHILRLYKTPYMDGSAVRTPFLTKEQIEAEGWTFLKEDKFSIWYKKENYTLQLIKNGSRGIYIIETDEVSTHNIFKGICKSINEFRTITKWLGI
jgi:hypothetical protein